MVEKKVYYRNVGEAGRVQSEQDQTELGHVGGGGRRERGEPSITARKPKVQEGRVTKKSELYREEPLGREEG